jgi:hypothetical protein
MLKKHFLFITVLFLSFGFQAQEDFKKPDYKKIEKAVKKKNSHLYYPELMKRFLEADSTMTLEERRHLYYGFIFQDAYNPYDRSPYSDSLNVLMRKKGPLSNDDQSELVRFADSVLAFNPFDLRTIFIQTLAYEVLGDNEKYDKNIVKLGTIINAIMSSGNGLKPETAYYVIYVNNEYDLLSFLGYKFGGKKQLIDHYDYLTLKDNPDNIKGLYFDISPSLNWLKNMLK